MAESPPAFAAVVLAAGKGIRMASPLPKVLHPVGGRPMVCRVVETARVAGAWPVVVVVGWGADLVRRAVRAEGAAGGGEVRFALQGEQRGTGHALARGLARLRGHRGTVAVLSGDVPLLRPQTLRAFLQCHRRRRAQASLLSVCLERPRGYGRVVREGKQGALREVVEEGDATPAQRAIREVNAGIYCFEAPFLRRFLRRLRPRREGEEVPLPGLFALAREAGLPVAVFRCPRAGEALGVNTPGELAAAERALRAIIAGAKGDMPEREISH